MDIKISSPNLYPLNSTALDMYDNASSRLFIFGANPPSSPTAVESDFSDNIF